MFLVNVFVISAWVVLVKSEVVNLSTQNDSDTYDSLKDNDVDVTTSKYPTATWSAPNYDAKKKKMSPEIAKLYLFKPSPFLKPPFTEGFVGAPIAGIEDGVNVNGHRRGSIKWQESPKTPLTTTPPPVLIDQRNNKVTKHFNVLDSFLEESLRNYIRSRNLTDELGTISVEMFSEALKRITEERKYTTPPYDENIELRKKFRDEILTPKRIEPPTVPSRLLDKQYQKRLKKTWEVINENISIPSRSAVLERREHWLTIELTTLTPSTTEVTTQTPQSTFRSETPRSEVIAVASDDVNKWSTTVVQSSTLFTTIAPTVRQTSPFSIAGESKIRSKPYRGKKKWRDSVRKIKEDNDLDNSELQLSVAETAYYRPRKTRLQNFISEPEADFSSIPGVPDMDYPMLSSPPATGFRCPNLNGGGPKMMADKKARCQVFYICTGDGPAAPMLCPNGTLFNENVLVCDWWYNVDC